MTEKSISPNYLFVKVKVKVMPTTGCKGPTGFWVD
jgi:hypothetical protein